VAVAGVIQSSTVALAASSPSPTPAGPSDVLDPARIVAGMNGDFWLTLLVTAVAGALGGLIFELIALQGGIELPYSAKKGEPNASLPYAVNSRLLGLGVFARIVVGAGAAVAVTLFIAPPNAFKLVALSIVAGSAGISVFRSMQDRLLAGLAQKDASTARDKVSKAGKKVEAAAAATKSLRSQGAASTGARALRGSGAIQPGLDLAALDEADRLLSEAKGILGE
jgi:hypothetical protein